MSARTKSMLAPGASSRIRSSTDCLAFERLSTMTSRMPSRASSTQVCAPMKPSPPVTTTVIEIPDRIRLPGGVASSSADGFAHDHPVAPFLFGPDQRGVGRMQDRMPALPLVGKQGDPDGQGDRPELLAVAPDLQFAHALPERFGALPDDLLCRLYHQGKFVSAVTHGDVLAARERCDALADAAQHGVPGRMSKGVVESLEMIDVDHHDCKRLPGAPGTRFLARKGFLEVSPVVQTGNDVTHGLVPQQPVCLHQLLFRPDPLLDFQIECGSRHL